MKAEVQQQLLRVSVLVPCRNEEASILQTLLSIARQQGASGEPFSHWAELIVVDDESSDRTPELLQQFSQEHPGTKVIRNEPRRGLSGSYNRAIREAKAPFVLTCHSDCRPVQIDYIHQMLEHFADKTVGAITGKPETPAFRELAFVEQLYIVTHLMDVDPEPKAVREINFPEGRCDAFRRDALISIGLYDEQTRISGEDQIISIRLMEQGLRTLQDTGLLYELSCGSSQNTTLKIIKRQMILAAGQAYVVLKHGREGVRLANNTKNRRQRKRMRLFQILSTLVALPAIAILGFWWPYLAMTLLVSLVTLRLMYHLWICGGRFNFATQARMFPYVMVCDAAYGFGFLRGVLKTLSNRQI